MDIKKVAKCKNGHYFIKTTKCPFCGENTREKLELRDGDCIACGQLCGLNLYACNQPIPITKNSI